MHTAIEQLQTTLGHTKVSTSPSVLEQHGRDENFPEVRPPLAVAYAESREDVQSVLNWCRTRRVPLIPFGAGTSLEGALVPAPPDVLTLSLDLSRMNQVISIQPDNFLAVVQPGITRTAFNEALKKQPNVSSEKLALYDKLIATIPNVERKGATIPYMS